jgi:hypothetical protein
MASFTSAGDSVTLGVMKKAGTSFDVALSGTYDMVIDLEVEVGAKGSGAWDLVKSYSTANATVAERFTTASDNERYRLFVTTDTSGTCTATLTEAIEEDLKVVDSAGNERYSLYRDNLSGGGGGFVPRNTPVNVTASTESLTRAEHAYRVVTANRAAGITFTLPAATGSGDVYKYYCGTTVTSNNNIIQAASASDIFKGVVWMAADGGDTVVAFESAADSDTMTMNGSTKGGIVGDYVVFEDVASGVWSFQAFLTGTGTEATPLSAAVS